MKCPPIHGTVRKQGALFHGITLREGVQGLKAARKSVHDRGFRQAVASREFDLGVQHKGMLERVRAAACAKFVCVHTEHRR